MGNKTVKERELFLITDLLCPAVNAFLMSPPPVWPFSIGIPLSMTPHVIIIFPGTSQQENFSESKLACNATRKKPDRTASMLACHIPSLHFKEKQTIQMGFAAGRKATGLKRVFAATVTQWHFAE